MPLGTGFPYGSLLWSLALREAPLGSAGKGEKAISSILNFVSSLQIRPENFVPSISLITVEHLSNGVVVFFFFFFEERSFVSLNHIAQVVINYF